MIEDAEFWGRIRRKELRFEGLDSLKVQWAYQIVGKKAKNRRVLRVLEFNGDQLAKPLSMDAIDAVPWSGVAGTDRQRDARRGPA